MADTLKSFIDAAALEVAAKHALASPSQPVPHDQAARNLEGAGYVAGVAGDQHPAVSRMYEKLDRARFRDVLVRGARALESITRSRQSTSYLNDAAKAKAEKPAPVVRAPASSSPSPSQSDGQTAAYVRPGRRGGLVQVQSYTTPTRRR